MRLEELTRTRVAEVAVDGVLVLAFGAIEQHGPHLPFGTDFIVVDAVTRRAAERVDVPLVVAPTLPFGSSHHHLEVGGALSLSAPTYEACARDLLASAAATGFRRAFVVNGHGGNEQLLRVAAQAGSLVVGGGSYWTIAGGLSPGHAGRFETSLALALGVDADAPARAESEPAHEATWWLEDRARWRRVDGFTDDPAAGSAEQGAALLERIVAAVAAALVEFDRATR